MLERRVGDAALNTDQYSLTSLNTTEWVDFTFPVHDIISTNASAQTIVLKQVKNSRQALTFNIFSHLRNVSFFIVLILVFFYCVFLLKSSSSFALVCFANPIRRERSVSATVLMSLRLCHYTFASHRPALHCVSVA